MGNDKFTKVVLVAIAVLLFVNVGQNAGWICDGQSKKSACTGEKKSECKKNRAQGNVQNFRLLPLLQARKVLRIDGSTGEVWYIDTRGMNGWRALTTLTGEEITEIEEARSGPRNKGRVKNTVPKLPAEAAVKPEAPAEGAAAE